eukprot:TRINITY_DN6737_c0_g1_i3.p1 TRINITY_DN6737_c0_g1~~TRINITY_DN6737_c0_g1_i3.p1  ORF type:complete len:326 (+),score=49.53 TRINITY_DN6737_c0_g1_i3:5-982(+)
MKVIVEEVLLREVKEGKFNNNNHCHFAPYVVGEEEVVVERDWYDGLLDITKQNISTIADSFGRSVIMRDAFDYPHDINSFDPVDISDYESIIDTKIDSHHDKESVRIYYQIYQAVIYQYDYVFWSDAIPWSISVIPLSRYDKKLLNALSLKYAVGGCYPRQDDIEDFTPDLISRIQRYVDEFGEAGIFAKLSTISAKNEKTLVPLHTVNEVLEYFICCKLFNNEYDKTYSFDRGLSLILMPWNENMNPFREFRVFYRNKKVVAISQQKWYKDIGLDPQEYEPIVTQIIELGNRLSKTLPFPNAIILLKAIPGENHSLQVVPYSAG